METHNMRLVPKYFDSIKKGIKQIELRLNDEKRQKIKIGDEIIFESVSDTPEYLKTKVVDLYKKESFQELLNMFEDIAILSDTDITKEELMTALRSFYTEEEEQQYGVVGIKVQVIE